jgi:hypothetical protein
MDSQTYSRSLVAIDRQLRKSLQYAGIQPDLRVQRVCEGSVEHYFVNELLPSISPYVTPAIQLYCNDIVKTWLSATFNPSSLIPKRADINNGKDVAKSLIENPKGGINVNLNIGDNNTFNAPLFTLPSEQGYIMKEELAKREKLLDERIWKPFLKEELYFTLLDVENEPEGRDEGVLSSFSKKSVNLSWNNGELKIKAKNHFREHDTKKPLQVDGIAYQKPNGDFISYQITAIFEKYP